MLVGGYKNKESLKLERILTIVHNFQQAYNTINTFRIMGILSN